MVRTAFTGEPHPHHPEPMPESTTASASNEAIEAAQRSATKIVTDLGAATKGLAQASSDLWLKAVTSLIDEGIKINKSLLSSGSCVGGSSSGKSASDFANAGTKIAQATKDSLIEAARLHSRALSDAVKLADSTLTRMSGKDENPEAASASSTAS
jgi:hypothetical protein